MLTSRRWPAGVALVVALGLGLAALQLRDVGREPPLADLEQPVDDGNRLPTDEDVGRWALDWLLAWNVVCGEVEVIVRPADEAVQVAFGTRSRPATEPLAAQTATKPGKLVILHGDINNRWSMPKAVPFDHDGSTAWIRHMAYGFSAKDLAVPLWWWRHKWPEFPLPSLEAPLVTPNRLQALGFPADEYLSQRLTRPLPDDRRDEWCPPGVVLRAPPGLTPLGYPAR
jgi:hypothetical protein